MFQFQLEFLYFFASSDKFKIRQNEYAEDFSGELSGAPVQKDKTLLLPDMFHTSLPRVAENRKHGDDPEN
jgi:hypothetical protein